MSLKTDYPLPIKRSTLQSFLPHRDPMLFVDSVSQLSDMTITTHSFVDPDANYFKGHFPGRPIMPGVLIIEAVAQSGALLVSLTRGLDAAKFIAFSSVESAKFKAPVLPGQSLTIEVEIERIRLPFYKFIGRASVDGRIVASLKFAAAEMEFKATEPTNGSAA